MDLKTLDYMENRAIKAKQLVEKIDNAKKAFWYVTGNVIGFESSCRLEVNLKSNSSKVEDVYLHQFFSGIVFFRELQQPIIDVISQEIERLEKELAEI
jgi:hypothetical protein